MSMLPQFQFGSYRLGLLLVTGSAIIWSTAGLFTRLIPLDAATLLVWRGLFAGVGLLALAPWLFGKGELKRVWTMGWPGLIYGTISALGMLLFIGSLTQTTVARVAIIYATAPFVAAALGWMLLRERPKAVAITSSLAALTGVSVMVGFAREGSWIGDVMALGMVVAMAALMVMLRRYPTIPALPTTVASAFLSAAAALPFASGFPASAEQFALLALFGLVNSALALALFTLGAKLLPPTETALIGALDAPLAPLWVWLLFNETPHAATLFGGAIVLVAVLGYVFLSLRNERA